MKRSESELGGRSESLTSQKSLLLRALGWGFTASLIFNSVLALLLFVPGGAVIPYLFAQIYGTLIATLTLSEPADGWIYAAAMVVPAICLTGLRYAHLYFLSQLEGDTPRILRPPSGSAHGDI